MRPFVVSLFLFVFVQMAWPQNPPLWRYWTQNDGLADTFCSTVTVAPNGDIWVNHGEKQQVSIFDGFSFRHITMPEILVPVIPGRENEAWSVFWQEKWHIIGGFLHWDGLRWNRIPHPDANLLSYYHLEKCLYSAGIDTFIYTVPQGIFSFNAHQQKKTLLFPASQTRLGNFNQLVRDEQRLWIAGENGIGHINLDDDLFPQPSTWQDYPLPSHLQQYAVHMPYISPDGSILAIAKCEDQQKVITFANRKWKTLYSTTSEQLLAIPRTPDSNWIIENFNVSFQLMLQQSQSSITIENNKILSGKIWGVVPDQKYNLWLTTAQGLACNLIPSWRTPDPIAHINEYCHSIHEDAQGRLWFGCFNYLLSYDNGTWKTIPLPVPANRYHSSGVCSLPDGRIVVNTGDIYSIQLIIYNPETHSITTLNHPQEHNIITIAPRTNGEIWVLSETAQGHRLESYDGSTFHFVADIANMGLGEMVYQIEESDDGTLWFCGYDQTVVSSLKDGVYRLYTEDDGYPGECMFSILDVGDGKVWFGARDRIIEFDGERFTIVKEHFERIRCMDKGADGSIWIASLAGVHRYYQNSWVQVDHKEGLPNASAISVYADSHNNIWVGTTNGLSCYDPTVDRDPPQTFISHEHNLQEIIGGEPINFLVSGLDKWKHTSSERLLYSYRIDQGEWTPFQNDPIISFSNTELSNGDHLIQVQAMDRDWNIDPTPASYAFIIVPPWYQNPAVYIIIGSLLLILTISIIYHFRHHFNVENQVKVRTAMLQKRNEQLSSYQKQLQALTSQLSLAEERERQSLATQLHDSFSQTLALSIMELSMLEDRKHKPLEKIRKRLDQVLQESKSLNFELCPPVLYSLGLPAAIKQAGETLSEQANITFKFYESNVIHITDDVRYFLFRACRELMINVIKHAHGTKLFVSVTQNQDTIKIIVHDNGTGFQQNPKQVGSGFGLFTIQERLQYSGGRLTIYTRQNIGSTILLTTSNSMKETPSS